MAGINMRQRLEWAKRLNETEGEKPGAGWTWAIYWDGREKESLFTTLPSISWRLLSLLLIAWYSLCHWEAFILEPICPNTLKKPECSTAARAANTVCSVTSWTNEEVASENIIFPASVINAPSCLLMPAAFSDMGELCLSRVGYSSYMGISQELKVHHGDDVVLTCAASSSEEPSYFWNKNVRRRQECAQWQCLHYSSRNLPLRAPLSSFLNPPFSVDFA